MHHVEVVDPPHFAVDVALFRHFRVLGPACTLALVLDVGVHRFDWFEVRFLLHLGRLVEVLLVVLVVLSVEVRGRNVEAVVPSAATVARTAKQAASAGRSRQLLSGRWRFSHIKKSVSKTVK